MHSKPVSYMKIACIAFFFSLIFSGLGMVQAGMLNGELCYALDDSFIMMALAKNLAFHGVWGLTPYEFSSTASSPLFTVLLAACFKILGKSIYIPLFINILTLLVLYMYVTRQSVRMGLNSWQIWLMLMGLFFFMPVPVLLFGSMEHLLHTLIAIWVLIYVSEKAEKSYPSYCQWFAFGKHPIRGSAGDRCTFALALERQGLVPRIGVGNCRNFTYPHFGCVLSGEGLVFSAQLSDIEGIRNECARY
jgi:hypothetical protein